MMGESALEDIEHQRHAIGLAHFFSRLAQALDEALLEDFVLPLGLFEFFKDFVVRGKLLLYLPISSSTGATLAISSFNCF